MIDLHCHLLPWIDDGAANLTVSLAMARALVADGVTTVACTPHIMPGAYNNTGPQIRAAVRDLSLAFTVADIGLELVTGADNHVVPDQVARLGSGAMLTLADSRYVLIEPPHHVAPQRLDVLFFNLLAAGYVPILTHPERLTWVPQQYELIVRLVRSGVWMQITAGSLDGSFGRGPRYWAERMLDEGLVHLLATDAHDTERRRPKLSRGRDLAARRVGEVEAWNLVLRRPQAVVADADPRTVPMPEPVGAQAGPGAANEGGPVRTLAGRLRRLLG